MAGFMKKTVLAASLAASTVAALAATPAMADRGPGGYHRGGGNVAGAAIAGGIVGLAVGALIASDRHPRAPVVYEPAYAPAPVYAAPVYAQPTYVVDPGWAWNGGWYWDHYGNRFYRDGRPWEYNGYARRGYYGGGYGGGYYGGGHEWREHGGGWHR